MGKKTGSKHISKDEWKKIREALAANPARYGLPQRVYGSVVLGSFNIRKIGKESNRNQDTWKFLAEVSRHFDLLAVQEIQDDLGGLLKLKDLMGPEFGMIVSDKTGVFPGEQGMGERLGFIYNWSMVKRTEVATDITFDRTMILNTIAMHSEDIRLDMAPYGRYLKGEPPYEALAPYYEEMRAYEDKLRDYNELVHQAIKNNTKKPLKSHKPKKPKRPKGMTKPKFKMPTFVAFIRSPYCVSFEITGHKNTKPYHIMAINAHLYFGKYMTDRRQEFNALMDWIRARCKEHGKAYYDNFILMGDLNLDFNNPKQDRKKIEGKLKLFNDSVGKSVHVNFPFLDVHKGRKEVFRTNARLSETFDQIGLFFRDERFPKFSVNGKINAVDNPRGPDYGVFDFVTLFNDVLNKKQLTSLSKEERKKFFAKFEHKVSDHMPLWLRMPLPLEE